MKKHHPYFWPLVFLFFLTPFIAETIASTNTAFITFINPAVLLGLSLLYGSAAIILRELWVRGKVGVLQFILLGASFAALNEGVVAASWFRPKVEGFTAAGLAKAGGINWQLVAGLILFHTFYSLLIPITLTTLTFPKISRQPWLRNKGITVYSLILLLVGLLSILPSKKTHMHWPMAAADRFLLLLIICFVVGVALRLPVISFVKDKLHKQSFGGNQLLILGLIYSIMFYVVYFALPRAFGGISVLFTALFYIATCATLLYWVRTRKWNSVDILQLVIGSMAFSLLICLVKFAVLQPIALVIFGTYFLYLYKSEQVRIA